MARPRAFSFPPDEMVKLGQEMIEWVIQNDPLHLSQWYTIHKEFTYAEWKTFCQCAEFLPYYEKALKLVGLKYLDKNSCIRDGISQRWQRVYFKDLREEEDETAKYNAQLNTMVVDNPQYLENIQNFMNMIDKAQVLSKELNKAETSKSDDTKSV